MSTTAELLAVQNSREAAVVGGVAALLATLFVVGVLPGVLGTGAGSAGPAIGGFTAFFYVLVLVCVNLYRR